MGIETLVTDRIVATMEEATRIAYIFFKGRLTRDTNQQAHDWLLRAAEALDVEMLCGVILDFRQVKVFDRIAAMKSTGKLLDMSLVPHALLVHLHQEQMVALCYGDQAHKCVVASDKEAMCFIDEWNRLHERGFESVARDQFSDVTIFNRYVLMEQMRGRGN